MNFRTSVCGVLAGFLLCLLSSVGHAETKVRLLETYPSASAPVVVVAPYQSVYLRIAYSLDSPASIWVRPYFRGEAVEAEMSPSPTYRGDGEAVGWFRFRDAGVEVDEILVRVGDGSKAGTAAVASWQLRLLVQADAPAAEPEPEWVTAFLDSLRPKSASAAATPHATPPSAQTSSPAEEEGLASWINGFTLFMLAVVLFGFGAPLWVAWHWRGVWRFLALLPAVWFAYVVVRIAVELAADPTSNNLWPMSFIFLAGCNFLALVVLNFARRIFDSLQERKKKSDDTNMSRYH